MICRSSEEVSLDLGVEDENESATGTTEDVGEGALEEGFGSFVLVNLDEAVHGAVVHLLSATRVHHESTTDGVKRVGNDAGADSNSLGETPNCEDVGVLHVGEEHDLASVEHTEVRGTVGNDTDDGDAEASVETCRAFLVEDLLEAVNETGELTVGTLTNISGEAGTGEIERVNDRERRGTSSTTGGAVTDEEHAWLLLGVIRVEDGLVEVLASEVEGLSGEVPHNVGHVTTPQRSEALLLDDTGEAVLDAVETILRFDA